MNDVEDRLRADLQAAGSPTQDRLAMDELLTLGHRRLSSHRRRIALASIASVAVIGVAIAGGMLGRGAVAVPEPALTASPPATAGSVSISPSWIGDQQRDYPPPYQTVIVEVSGQIATVTGVPRIVGGKPVTPKLVRTVVLHDGVTLIGLGPEMVVAVLPPGATPVEIVAEDAPNGSTTDQDSITALRRIVVVTHAPGWSKRNSVVRGVVWRDAEGTMRSSSGAQVNTATVPTQAGELTVYADAGLKEVGYLLSGQTSAAASSPITPNGVMYVNAATTGNDDGRYALSIGILPKGGSDPTVDLTKRGSQVATGLMRPDGRVVIVVVYRQSNGKEAEVISLVRSVSYTSADGKRVRTEEG